MTFSILAVSLETAEYGFAQTTSTPLVGDRVTVVVQGRGVATVQAAGNYQRTNLARELLTQGCPPDMIVDRLRVDERIEGRQIAVMDIFGNKAVRTGAAAWPW